MAWYTEGLKTDPSTGDVLADTGALSISTNFTLITYASNYGYVEIQHRNALNTSTLHAQKFIISAGSPATAFSIPVTLSLNERLRVVMTDDFTGTIQVSILT